MSKSLTRIQIDYAEKRVRQIINDAFNAEAKKLGNTPPKPGVDYTDEEKLAMIAAGKAKLLNKGSGEYYGYITKAFEYPPRKMTGAQKAAKAAYDKHNAAFEKLRQKYDDVQQEALDKIYLMGADEALKFLGDFEKKLAG